MSLDNIVRVSVWGLTFYLLLKYVPRDKFREGFVIFAFKQIMTWFFGLMVVQFGLITYPVREFPKATNTSFSFEYFVYPSVCVIFNLNFPVKKSMVHKVGWYLFFPTWMTALEILIEKNTNLITYIHWSWYWTWITLWLTFFFSRQFYKWYFKLEK